MVVSIMAAACVRTVDVSAPSAPNVTAAQADRSADAIWQFVGEHPRPSGRPNPTGPYAIVRFDRSAFDRVLQNAPLESGPGGIAAGVIVSLPMPDRTFARVRVAESPILAPELAAQFPEIKTYVGQGVDDGTITVRFGWTQNGFHALVLGASGDISIDPYIPGDLEYCITMRKAK